MAFTSKEWKIVYVFEDNNKDRAVTEVRLPISTAWADVDTAASTFAAVLAAASNAVIRSYSISVVYSDIGAATTEAASEVQRKGSFVFAASSTGDTIRIEVPSLIFTAETNGTDVLSSSNAAVNSFITSVTSADTPFVTNSGQAVDTFVRGMKIHRSRSSRRK